MPISPSRRITLRPHPAARRIIQALERAHPRFAILVAPVADMRPFGRLRTRLAAPDGWRPLGASVLVHAAMLAALVALHHARLGDAEPPPIEVTVTPGDPDARVGPHAGIAWDAAADQPAVLALLDTRRASSLIGELVISPGPSPRRVNRPTSSRRAPPLEASLARVEPSQAAAPPARPPAPAPTQAVPTLPLVPEPTTLAAAPPDEPAPPIASPAPPVRRPDPPTPPSRLADATPTPPPERAAASAPAAIPAVRPAAAPASPAPSSRADQGYFDAVLKHLRSVFKDYPGLEKYHATGTVEVALTIGPDGTVLSAEVRRSSNYSFFDRAGLDIIHRASPMPAPPAGTAAITVPIKFWYD